MEQICLFWIYEDGLKKRRVCVRASVRACVCVSEMTGPRSLLLPVGEQAAADDASPPDLGRGGSQVRKTLAALFIISLF